MNYDAHLAEHLRLAILQLLVEAPGYRANDSVLLQCLDALGFTVSRDQVAAQVAWLEEQGLVSTGEPRAGLTVATITPRGVDTAEGRARVPGVQRPSPKAAG